MAFWNVTDLVNNDEFWEGFKDWDVMMLSETWVEVEGWRRVREKVTGGVYLEVASGLEKTRKRKGEGEENNDGDKKGVDEEKFRDGQGGGNNDGVRETG